jgi:hypothetical protein
MSEEKKSIERISERIKSLVDLFSAEEGTTIKVITQEESGLIKIYTQDVNIVKKASSGLEELLELSYATAEHHPYWSILYSATEILKTILDSWDSDLSRDQISEMSWRIDELSTALSKVGKFDR